MVLQPFGVKRRRMGGGGFSQEPLTSAARPDARQASSRTGHTRHMATYRRVVQHLRALDHQAGPLRCAERRDVGDGEMTRASITYEQQRLVDAKLDYQRRTRRLQNSHRGQPHPAAARGEVLPRRCVSERVAFAARQLQALRARACEAPVKTRSNAPSSRCFLPRVPTAACNSLVGETDPVDKTRY